MTEIRGVIFQSDGQSTIGRLWIRPFEALDRWVVGILPRPGDPPLAMHTGLHIIIDNQKEYVAEQLVGNFYLDFRNGLNWTPYDKFKERDRGGWDVTLLATTFRAVDERAVDESVGRLNAIEGHPFIGEDCTAFVERAFGNRRLFADSPLLRSFGIGLRVGDPALPLIKPDAIIGEPARSRLQIDKIRHLPDPLADAQAPNARLWLQRLLPLALITTPLVVRNYSSGSRKSTPISSTARKFLR